MAATKMLVASHGTLGKAAAHGTGPGQRSEPQLDPEGEAKPPPLSPENGPTGRGPHHGLRIWGLGQWDVGRLRNSPPQWVPSKD